MTATIPFSSLHACPAAPVPVTGADSRPALSVREVPDLSEREIEVLVTWLFAETKREVTETLFLAESTVSTYIQRVRSKYEAVGRPARTKVRLFVRAVEDGLIDVDDIGGDFVPHRRTG